MCVAMALASEMTDSRVRLSRSGEGEPEPRERSHSCFALPAEPSVAVLHRKFPLGCLGLRGAGPVVRRHEVDDEAQNDGGLEGNTDDPLAAPFDHALDRGVAAGDQPIALALDDDRSSPTRRQKRPGFLSQLHQREREAAFARRASPRMRIPAFSKARALACRLCFTPGFGSLRPCRHRGGSSSTCRRTQPDDEAGAQNGRQLRPYWGHTGSWRGCGRHAPR